MSSGPDVGWRREDHLAAARADDEVAREVGRAAGAGALEARALGRGAQAVEARGARHEAQLGALLHQAPDPPIVAEFLKAANHGKHRFAGAPIRIRLEYVLKLVIVNTN